jgi:hypothetical protein
VAATINNAMVSFVAAAKVNVFAEMVLAVLELYVVVSPVVDTSLANDVGVEVVPVVMPLVL